MTDLKVQLGIQPEHIKGAARLYAFAFQKKFEKILDHPEAVSQLLEDGINPQRGIAALSQSNELLGISGFHMHGTSFTDLQIRSLVRKYGIIKGVFKFIMLALLFHRKPDNKHQLLMDGIVVKEGNRGRGTGKLLFAELEKLALQNHMTSIRLDVIDENPKAKILYGKLGFIPVKYTAVPQLISRLIGVSGVTTMVKEL